MKGAATVKHGTASRISPTKSILGFLIKLGTPRFQIFSIQNASLRNTAVFAIEMQ